MQLAPLGSHDLIPWANLLSAAFERQPHQMNQLLRFLQPETQLVAWGAWDGDTLAAQYSCLLRDLYFPTLGHSLPVGLSINMAVHPNYRGRGLVKQVAEPVYAALTAQGVAAGVGFSNAAGVQVDRQSSGYGYQVVGQLRPFLLWLRSQKRYADFKLTTAWPTLPFAPAAPGTAIQFAWNPASLRQRFACHPFRKYQFGIWQQDETIAGIVVYRPIRLGRYLPAVALLAVYGHDIEAVLQRWLGALREEGHRLIHVVCSPTAPILATLGQTAVCLPQPISRNPYYLTVKPLSKSLPEAAVCFDKWSCLGGDVL
jgi:hypothetical protein